MRRRRLLPSKGQVVKGSWWPMRFRGRHVMWNGRSPHIVVDLLRLQKAAIPISWRSRPGPLKCHSEHRDNRDRLRCLPICHQLCLSQPNEAPDGRPCNTRERWDDPEGSSAVVARKESLPETSNMERHWGIHVHSGQTLPAPGPASTSSRSTRGLVTEDRLLQLVGALQSFEW